MGRWLEQQQQNNIVDEKKQYSPKKTIGKWQAKQTSIESSLPKTAVSFIKNLPTSVLRTLTSASELAEQTGTTIGSKLGRWTGKKLQPLFANVPEETKKKIIQFATSAKTGLEGKDITLPYQDIPIKEAATEKTGRQLIGKAGEAALDIGTMFVGAPGASTIVKTGLKEVAKAGAKQTLKKALSKDALKIAARTMLADATVGAGYGVATTLQNKEATGKDYLKAGLTGAVLGAAAPKVLGASIKVGVVGTKLARKQIGRSLEATALKLESKAGRETQEIMKGIKEKPFIHTPEIKFVPKTLSEYATELGAKAIRTAQKIPFQTRKYFAQKYAAVADIQKDVKNIKNLDIDLEEKRQRLGNKIARISNLKISDLTQEIGRTGGKDWQPLWSKTESYLQYLDDLDRISVGKDVTGGHSKEALMKDFIRFQKTLTPDERTLIRQNVAIIQKYLKNELDTAFNVGRITQGDYNRIRVQHKNYLPFYALSERETEIPLVYAKAGSISGQSLKMKKAEGTTRERVLPLEAITKYLGESTAYNEEYRFLNSLFDSVKGVEEKLGFIPLRTSEQVLQKQSLLRDLSSKIKETRRAIRLLKTNKKFSEKVEKKVKLLEEELEITTNTLREDLQQYFNGEELKIMISEISPEKLMVIPKELVGEGEKAAKYKTFKEFFESPDGVRMEGKSLNGELEEFGFVGKTPEDELLKFWETSKGFFKPEVGGKERIKKIFAPTTKELGAKSKTQKRLFRTTEEKKEINLTSAEEAFYYAQNLVERLKQDKVNLRKQLEEIKIKEIKDIDVPEGKEKVTYLKDGIVEQWLVPEELGQVLKGTGEFGPLMQWINNTGWGKFIRGISGASLLRQVAIEKNPMFAIFRNPARDIQTAKVMADVSIRDIGKGLLYTLFPDKAPKEYQIIAREAETAGIFGSGVFRDNSNNIPKLLDQVLTEQGLMKRTIPQNLAYYGNIVGRVGQAFEEATRRAVFQSARRKGFNPEQAAKLGANATVDFSRSGSLIQVVNTVVPFLNARIQGALNLGKLMVNKPDEFVRKLMFTAAYPTVVLNAWNTKYESYWNIPENERRKYWIIMAGESLGRDYNGKQTMIPHYVTIPKGEAQQAMSSLIDRVLNFGKDKYPLETKDFLLRVVGDISPVQGASLLPFTIQKAVELPANYSFYRGKEIVPEWVKFKNKWYKTDEIEPRYRYNKDYTSQAAKVAGDLFNWSPAKIDYLIRTGVMNEILRTFDTGIISNSKDLKGFQKAAEIPFLSSILGTSSYGLTEKEKQEELKEKQEKASKKIKLFLENE